MRNNSMAPPSEEENTTQVVSSNIVRRSGRRGQPPKRLSDEHTDNVAPKPNKKMKSEMKKDIAASTKEEPDSGDENEYKGPQLSEYELERLETIRQNQAFLSSLNLPQIAETLRPKKPSQLGLKKEKVVKEKEVLPPRKSRRLQNKDADFTVTPNAEPELKEEEVVLRYLEGPVPMCPLNVEDEGSLPEDLLHLWAEEPVKYDKKKVDLERYKEGLQKMCIKEERVVKVVKDRVFRTAFHPCASSLLMAAGDKWGKIGLWNLDATWGDNGVLLFEPHTRPITSMKFSKSQPTTLITTSYDGTARAGDVERATFDEVYRSKDLKTFDFLSDDCTTLLIGTTGCVSIVDMRTPGTSHESLHVLDPLSKAVRCVHVHPVQRQYFVVAESSGVHIYDARCLKKKSNQAVSGLEGHSRSVSCAYFSPHTGNRVLTTSFDDLLRVFDTSQMISSPPLITSIRHNTHTGRWLSKMEAVWDPKQEDCFAVGCMEWPRRIKVFHESGKLLHTLQNPDHLTTVCPVVAFHPSRFALVGGNSSGRLHIFT